MTNLWNRPVCCEKTSRDFGCTDGGFWQASVVLQSLLGLWVCHSSPDFIMDQGGSPIPNFTDLSEIRSCWLPRVVCCSLTRLFVSRATCRWDATDHTHHDCIILCSAAESVDCSSSTKSASLEHTLPIGSFSLYDELMHWLLKCQCVQTQICENWTE